jgi:hypothetical protein
MARETGDRQLTEIHLGGGACMPVSKPVEGHATHCAVMITAKSLALIFVLCVASQASKLKIFLDQISSN